MVTWIKTGPVFGIALIMLGLMGHSVQAQDSAGGSDFTLGLLGDELLEGLKASQLLNGKTRVAVWPFQSRDKIGRAHV